MSDERGSLTVREAGKLGGDKRKAAGADYSALGKAGGRTTRERHGAQHYVEIGRQGGAAALEKLGREHYVTAGRKGAARMRDLVAKGKAAEQSSD